jgi:hypothetical protein
VTLRRVRVVWFEDTGEEREVERGCLRCGVTEAELDVFRFVLSPAGIAHHTEWEKTACGIDATGPDWWWPI